MIQDNTVLAEQQTYMFDANETSTDKFNLQLSNFSGPLDFLLHLVKENKIEIRDIFISQVTEQFLAYMTQIAQLDIDQASEYMAISATLLEIKSRALLPEPEVVDDGEEDVKENLIRQLEEYKLFKEVVGDLKEQENVNRFYREPEKNVGVAVSVIKDKLDLEGFMSAFNAFLLRFQAKTEEANVSRAIVKETFTIVDRIQHISEVVEKQGSFKFFSLFTPNSSKLELITTFSAILEMLKMQLITVKQAELFEDFEVERREGADFSEVKLYEAVE